MAEPELKWKRLTADQRLSLLLEMKDKALDLTGILLGQSVTGEQIDHIFAANEAILKIVGDELRWEAERQGL